MTLGNSQVGDVTGYEVMSHQYPSVSSQVKAGLYVLKRFAFYLRKIAIATETQATKIAEVASHEKETKHQHIEVDRMGSFVGALLNLHQGDLWRSSRMAQFAKAVQSDIVTPMMSTFQALEKQLQEIDERCGKITADISRAYEQYQNDKIVCSNTLAKLRELRDEAQKSGGVQADIKAALERGGELGSGRSSIKSSKSVSSTVVVKEGWLDKAGQFNRSFKRRYCKLFEDESGNQLAYFRGKSDKKPAGVIKLDGSKIKPSISDPAKFDIHTSGRVFSMRAETKQICQEWVNALREYKSAVNKSLLGQLEAAKTKAKALLIRYESSQIELDAKVKPFKAKLLPSIMRGLQQIDENRLDAMGTGFLAFSRLRANLRAELTKKDLDWEQKAASLRRKRAINDCVFQWVSELGPPPKIDARTELSVRSTDLDTSRWLDLIAKDPGEGGGGARTPKGPRPFVSPKVKLGGQGEESQDGDKRAAQSVLSDDGLWHRVLEGYNVNKQGHLSFKYDDIVVVTSTDAAAQSSKDERDQVLARAQHDFAGDPSNGELAFKRGDAIVILGKEETTQFKNWWKGRLKGQEGLVPSNYVTEMKTTLFKTARVIFDYEATNSSELTIRKGDIVTVENEQPQWSMVRKADKFGRVPTTFLEVLVSSQIKSSTKVRMFRGFLAGQPGRIGVFPAHFVQSLAEKADHYESDEDDELEENKRGASKASKVLASLQHGAVGFLRNKVSKEKRRFQNKDFDLDLTYIEPNLIAMGFPSEGKESYYRNSMRDVQRFFESRHAQVYRIFNLCSERHYDAKKFNGRVSEHPFDDHNPCPFNMIQSFVTEASAWMRASPKNVIAVHCKAGKGRTGFMITCLLIAANPWFNAGRALRYFAAKRTKDCQGVTIPSQRRFADYFHTYLRQKDLGLQIPDTRPLRLLSVRIQTIPKVIRAALGPGDVTTDCWFVARSQFRREGGKLVSDIEYSSRGKIECKVRLGHDFLLFSGGLAGILSLDGDARLEFFCLPNKSLSKKPTKMFRCWFNTRFLLADDLARDNRLIFSKTQLDGAVKDKRHKIYSNDLELALTFNSAM